MAPGAAPHLSDDRLTAMGLLVEVAAGLGARVDAQLARWHLAANEFGVLLRVGRSPEQRLRMTDLAAQVGLSNSGLTRLVDRLVHTDHLAREACPNDGRGTFAVLTPRGRALLAEVVPAHLALLDEWLVAPFEPGELTDLVARLRTLRDHVAPDAAAPDAVAADATPNLPTRV